VIKRIIHKLRRTFFPTIQDRWRAVHGDTKLRLQYPLPPDSLVMDLGGFEGQWAADINSRYDCRVIVFEPVAAFAEKIRERFQTNPSIEVCQYGLGHGNRNEQIHLSADGSSIFVNDGQTETITIRDAIEFQGFIESIRADLDEPTLPVVAGILSAGVPYAEEVNSALGRVAEPFKTKGGSRPCLMDERSSQLRNHPAGVAHSLAQKGN
jgi:hypothetical protein